MKKEKQIVALTELKSHLTKQEIISIIMILVIVSPIFIGLALRRTIGSAYCLESTVYYWDCTASLCAYMIL